MGSNSALRLATAIGTVALCLLMAAGPGSAQQAYPSQPLRFVIAFGPGGVGDTTSRLVAERLGDKLGQRVVVENNPGGGGIAAARSVLTAPADGHTLALLTNGTSISVSLFKALSFDPIADFAPVTKLGKFEFFLTVAGAAPFRTLNDLITAARANPGSTQHLSALLLKSTSGIEFQWVPFRNSPDLLVAMLRGDIDMAIDAYAAFKPQFDDGKLKPLATSAPTRSPILPAVATAKESGAGDYDVTAWNGMFVKAGTPPAIIAKLNQAMREVLGDPDLAKFQGRYRQVGRYHRQGEYCEAIAASGGSPRRAEQLTDAQPDNSTSA